MPPLPPLFTAPEGEPLQSPDSIVLLEKVRAVLPLVPARELGAHWEIFGASHNIVLYFYYNL